jgi:site-specific recombinase XerD
VVRLLVDAAAYQIECLEAEEKSPRTLEQYQLVHRVYLRFLRESLGDESPTLAALNPSTARLFIAWLKTEHSSIRHGSGLQVGHSDASIAQYVSCLKAFATFIFEHKKTRTNQLARLKTPQVTRKEIEIFKPAHVRNMLAHCADTHHPERNRAFLSLLADTGIRISEGLFLRLDDYEPWTMKGGPGRAKVLGKGKKERYVSIGRELSVAIRAYLKFERPDDAQAPWLFLGADGGPLTRSLVDQVIKFVAGKAGVPPSIRASAHTFRHTWATIQAMSGNTAAIQTALGHARPDMTMRYIRRAELERGGMDSLLDEWKRKDRES